MGQMLVSPGALDTAGLLITPREEDFVKIDEQKATEILKECGANEQGTMKLIQNTSLRSDCRK